MVALGSDRPMTGSGGRTRSGGAALGTAPRNVAQAAAILLALAAMAGAAGVLVAGNAVGIAVAALAVVYTIGLSFLPPSMLMQLHGARAVPHAQAGRIGTLLGEIAAERAGLPHTPQLYVLPSLEITAFSLGGRSRAAIAVSEGLLRRLTLRETAGMLAHEVAHIRSGDAQLFALSDASARVAQLLGLGGTALLAANAFGYFFGDPLSPWTPALVLYAAPALTSLLQLALSHAREIEADAGAAELTGDALGLAGAIRRLPDQQGSMLEDLTPPAFARRVPAPSLLRSHPAPEARIERLLPAAAAAEPGTADRMPPLAVAEEPLLLHVGFGPAQMRPRYRWPGVWW